MHGKTRIAAVAVLVLPLFGLSATGAQGQTTEGYGDWLETLREEALTKGISSSTLDMAFADIEPLPRVVELDRRQPEFTQTFWTYMDRRVTEERIREGRELLKENAALLADAERTYGVQARFIVAFWGLETNYGATLGGFPVIGALTTLAYDERRSAFFRAQLFDALRILEDGHIAPKNMIGSWAGAMGQPQFMPSTFVRHAVDANGDGKKDIWGDRADVFASAAAYLKDLGWNADYTWGREVQLPESFDWTLAELRTTKSLAGWQELGVRRIDGRDLPEVAISGSIILPAGASGPAFLVYDNFRAILGWNRSLFYAVSVGHLADRIAGMGQLQSPRRPDKPLSREDVTALQERLASLGFDPGDADGQVGPATRAAVKAYQLDKGLPADGFPSHDLYEAVLSDMPDETPEDESP